jgi:hypothetical protein
MGGFPGGVPGQQAVAGYPGYPQGGGMPGQQAVAGATNEADCGCGPSPQQQMYRGQNAYGYPQAPYGMVYPGYGVPQAGYPMGAPGYFATQGYGYGPVNEEYRNGGSDFEGPENDDES